ncbi:molybdate ABC transporter substrate-binding protein [Sulfurimonas sp.]|uniref:molybdate ABC transporter substrate-binding protein n=1 Tax=Sulfurimonas sp. TaxID=2022749 RepID=UPI0026253C0E|nr:molybdate ABC transporter substrate-binding protein [Sulfurimonas sp.]
MKKTVFLLLFIMTNLFAEKLNIAVAANVGYAINDLVTAFNKTHPSTKVQITLGGSGKLTAQINRGAPYDILMSANMKYPQSLYKTGQGASKPRVYAQGALALFSAKVRDFSQGINIVKNKDIHRIAIANPKTAPYGKASVQALQNAKLYEAVKSKFIYGESIAQTVAFSVTAADLGFIAKSALYSDKMQAYKENKNWIALDTKLYTPIKQGIIILKRAKTNTAAKAFYDFISSTQAQKIFQRYGYTLP